VVAGASGLAAFPEMVRRGDRVEVGGTAFVVSEWDAIVLTVAISCCARHHRMAIELAMALDGGADVTALAPDGERRALLGALDDLGLLERHEPRRWDGDPRVTWMGHAGVLYEAGGRRVLVDTIAFPRSAPTRHATRPFDPRDLGALDAVLITHGDNDHFHPALLYRVPRHVPVVIPSCPDPRPYQVDMRAVLEAFGFERIVEVDEWQRVDLGGVTVIAAPFRGEDWGLSLPCRSYVIASEELTVYLNADSTSTPEAYARIAAEHRVDLAFLGVTGAEESLVMPPGFGYGNFYARWIPPERRNEWMKMCNGPRDSAEVARALGARHAFGYAAGGVPFYPSAYVDRGTHEELAACLAELGAGTRPLALAVGVPTAVPR
jgi:L-ascorbate metabolism protein UlaG (beta-lactamase superfamily)